MKSKVIQTARLVTRINLLKGVGNILKDNSFENISGVRTDRMKSKYEGLATKKTIYFFDDRKKEKHRTRKCNTWKNRSSPVNKIKSRRKEEQEAVQDKNSDFNFNNYVVKTSINSIVKNVKTH